MQPGIGIDYATGDSWVDQKPVVDGEPEISENADASDAGNTTSGSSDTTEQTEYIINTNTGKFHKPSCSSVKKMKTKNKKEYTGSREELISEGYRRAGKTSANFDNSPALPESLPDFNSCPSV